MVPWFVARGVWRSWTLMQLKLMNKLNQIKNRNYQAGNMEPITTALIIFIFHVNHNIPKFFQEWIQNKLSTDLILTHRLLQHLHLKIRSETRNKWILTKILRVWNDTSISLIISQQVVHLYVGHEKVCSHQIILLMLRSEQMLIQSVYLTEAHVRLHPCKVLERSRRRASFLIKTFSSTLESLWKSSSEVHHLYSF